MISHLVIKSLSNSPIKTIKQIYTYHLIKWGIRKILCIAFLKYIVTVTLIVVNTLY